MNRFAWLLIALCCVALSATHGYFSPMLYGDLWPVMSLAIGILFGVPAGFCFINFLED